MSEVVAAPTLRPIITSAGLAAAIKASTLGTECEITHVGIGNAPGVGHEDDIVLQGEQFRLPVADGKTVSPFQVNIAALITDTHPTISIHGIGFYLADGTLFAVYQTEDPLIYHKAGSSLLVGMDVVMSNIPAGSIIVESTGANLVLGDFVPMERTINGISLRKDVTLTAADVGAVTAAEVALMLKSVGGDRIGSVAPMMSVQDHLVHDGDKVYLKEGVTLEDAANQFPEAFAKLNGAKGKQFLISTGGRTVGTGRPCGFATRGNKVLVVSDTGSATSVIEIDIKTRFAQKVAQHSFRSPANYIEHNGKLITSIAGNKFVAIDIADPTKATEQASPVGNWGTDYLTLLCKVKGGFIGGTGTNKQMAFVSVNDAGSITNLVKYDITAASSAFKSILSFTDKTGNVVNFAVTSGGEIFWKAGEDHATATGWVKKWSRQGPVEYDFSVEWGVYSVEADVVYFADSKGAYAVCDPRMSPLNAAGDVALFGFFQGEYEMGLTFAQIGDTIFANPLAQSQTDGLNMYYRLDPKTAKWDSFKHGVNIRISNTIASIAGAQIGDSMLAFGLLGTAGSGSYTPMISSPVVHLQADPTTKGGIANYVRIK